MTLRGEIHGYVQSSYDSLRITELKINAQIQQLGLCFFATVSSCLSMRHLVHL